MVEDRTAPVESVPTPGTALPAARTGYLRACPRSQCKMVAVVFLWIVLGLLVVLATISSVAGSAGMLLQHAARAVTPSKVAHQVEVGPTGTP